MAYPAAKSGFSLEDLTKMGPDEITRKRKLAEALLAQSSGIKRIEHPLQGMAQLAEALIGNLQTAKLDRAERQGKEGANALFSAGMGMGEFPAAPSAQAPAPTAAMADGPKGMESYLANVIGAESGGNPNAKNPRSSATGLGQFIDSTWRSVAERHPELGLTPDGRTDPEQSKRALIAFTQDNAKSLSTAGIPITGGSLYAAHFLGDRGAAKVLSAPPGTPLSSLVGEGVIRANPFLRGMKVSDFQNWAAKKGGMGAVTFDEGGAPAQQAPGAAPTQVASIDPAAGLPAQAPSAAPAGAVPAAYSKIPEKDSMGLTNQRAKFMEWNPDPVGNEEKNLASINPDLARVVRRAKEIAGVPFVVGSGKRDEAMQAKAVKWGWSKTNDSDHLGGNATDLWPLDEDGAVVFDPGRQAKIAAAMKQAASELGVQIEAGADWKHPDRPHFGIKGGGTQVASLDPAAGLPQTAPVPQSQQEALGKALVGAPVDPAPSAQVPIPAPAAGAPVAPFGQGATPAGQVQLAQALTGGQPDIGLTMGTTPHQPGEGPDLRTLMNMAGNEFMNPNQMRLIEALTGQRMEQAAKQTDPAYQLDLETKRAQLDALRGKKQKNWQKLDDNTLFDPDSGETKEIGTAGGPTKFEGTGLEAQAWNILQSADPSSREYATAYSIVSQPKTQLVQTENGMMPVEVPPSLPAWLKALGEAGAAGAGPASAPPQASPSARAAFDELATGKPPDGSGVIPGTKKPKTEMQARNGAIGKILLNEVPTLGANFKALSDPKGQLLSKLPAGIGNMWQSEEYQRAAASVKTSISNVLYSLSGASSNPGEVVKQIEVLTPEFGDKPGAIADKLQRFKTYVRAISSEANDPELTRMVEEAIAGMDTPAAPTGTDAEGWKELMPGVKIRPRAQ